MANMDNIPESKRELEAVRDGDYKTTSAAFSIAHMPKNILHGGSLEIDCSKQHILIMNLTSFFKIVTLQNPLRDYSTLTIKNLVRFL